MNLGYTGKPYDAGTGLYNYGFRDYRPQVARFTTADPVRDGSNWYAYVNNDPVNYIDLWGLAPRNMTEEEREAYKAVISSYSAYSSTNTMSVPSGYDCADLAAYLYGEGMTAAGYPNAITDLQAGQTNLTQLTIPNIHSSDFFSNPNNITFYDNTSFNSPDIEVGTIAVWQGSQGTGNQASWDGHIATILEVQRDANGNVTSIVTFEGHIGRTATIDMTNTSQAIWDSYTTPPGYSPGTFLGFGEIGLGSTTPYQPPIDRYSD
jgi:RHS repeat-associated protein